MMLTMMINKLSSFILEHFASYGLSEDEVTSLIEKGVICIEHGHCWTRVILDGEPLFEIILTDRLIKDDRSPREISFKCIDLKEVKEDAESNI